MPFEEDGLTLPIMISGTLTDASGRTISGQAAAFYNSLRHCRPLFFGFNCALGPDSMRHSTWRSSPACARPTSPPSVMALEARRLFC